MRRLRIESLEDRRLLSISFHPPILYVDTDAPGGNDGTSWQSAFVSLQDALVTATAHATIEEIRVAEGVYAPDQGAGQTPGNREATFQLVDDVVILGGFAGFGGADPDGRDIEAHETILSGDLAGDDGPDFANRGDNSYHVVTGGGWDTGGLVDGVTIAGGNADGERWYPASLGGGLYEFGGTLRHCVVRDNMAHTGAGLYQCTGVMEECVIEDNFAAARGGGVFLDGLNSTFIACTFRGNVAQPDGEDGRGGGMYTLDNSPDLANCVFTDNLARAGGGLVVAENSGSTISDCLFVGNRAEQDGGGVYAEYGGTAALANCTFEGNSADHGGGVSCELSALTLNACLLVGNQGSHGAGMANSGDVLLSDCTFRGHSRSAVQSIPSANTTYVDCSFLDNSLGVVAYGGTSSLTNCLFSGNTKALFLDYCDPVLTNCTIYASDGVIGLDGGASATLNNCIVWEYDTLEYNWLSPESIQFNYSCIEGWTDDLGGTANFGDDPLLIDADGPDGIAGTEDDDLRLLPGSPCIEAGDNAAVPPHVTADLDGNPRIVNAAVDIGAYEFQGPFVPEVLYVDDDAPGANDGTNWEDAFVYLQDALDTAAAHAQVREIRVAQGTYQPDQGNSQTPGDRETTFQLVSGVVIAGGFAGFGEADPDARDVDLYSAVLSGDLAGDDGTEFTRNEENSFHVVTGSGTDATAVLDGFTITAGNASSYDDHTGAGMYNDHGSPTLIDCSFSANYAGDDDGGSSGGGMYNQYSNPTLTGCSFVGNYSLALDWGEGHGGAMRNWASSPVLTGCTFIENYSGQHGGAMHNYQSDPVLTDCTFSGNLATKVGGASHGGAMWNYDSDPVLTGCTFTDNFVSAGSDTGGGAIYNADGSEPALTDCTFVGNYATGAWEVGKGGAVYSDRASPTLMDCSFSKNSAWHGGAIYSQDSTTLTLSGCTFSYNTADGRGGGIYSRSGTASLTACRFEGNSAEYDGAGLYSNDTDLLLTDCTFIANVGRDYHDAPGAGMSIDGGEATLLGCAFLGNSASYGGGLRNSGGETLAVNCIFSGNTVRETGGAIVALGGLTLVNCTIAANSCDWYGTGGVQTYSDVGVTLVNCILWGNALNGVVSESSQIDGEAPIINSSCVQGWTGNLGGIGNTGADPMLVDADGADDVAGTEDDNLRLLSGSPCIDAGDNTAVPIDVVTDLDGNPRIVREVVDMGAYEYQGPRMLYVDDDAPNDPGHGTPDVSDPLEDGSEVHPFDAIQEAIDVARCADTVLVLDGTYTGTGNRDIDFTGKAITVRSQNGPEDCIVDCQGSAEEPHRGFYFGSGEDEDSVLRGFTITGGYVGSHAGETKGSGIYCGGSSPSIVDCTLTEDCASGHGAALCNDDSSSPTIVGCTFFISDADHTGTGVLNRPGSNPTLTDCKFFQYDWAAMQNFGSAPTLINCVFSDNRAAIFSDYSFPTLINCTIVGHQMAIPTDGGAIVTATNCIFWDNQEMGWEEAGFVIRYSCVEGGWEGEGNIDADPLFVDAAIGDYRLQPGSPCIDAGNNAAVPLDLLTDLDGNSRIVNETVDMGAYEFQAPFVPEVLYVDNDALGDNDGASWEDAFVYLQDALDVAAAHAQVREVRVAQGTYQPDQGSSETPGDREATFQLLSGVVVLGGYAGFDTADPDAHDPVAFVSVLSGDLAGDDAPITDPFDLWHEPSRNENSVHVVTGNGTDATAVLDGFTITAGKADDWRNGGGAVNFEGTPTYRNCAFVHNWANKGGGMYNAQDDYDGLGPLLVDCMFLGNWGNDCGGGMYNSSSSPTLINCTFSGNMAEDWGGGGMFNSDSDPTLINCTMTGNWASDGGSGIYNSSSNPVLANCIVWGNRRDQITRHSGSPEITYSVVQGGWEGEGNLDVDPQLLDADGSDGVFGTADDNLRLMATSPCINVGSNAAVPDDVLTDLDGNPRIVGETVDMGAYEFPALVTGEIRGAKFNDLDADGRWDDGEPGLEGWTIYVDANHSGTLDDGEPSAVTDAQGQYSLGRLEPGVHTVAEVRQDDWILTFPNTPDIQRASISESGEEANGHSGQQTISADGRYVAFRSAASNLVPADTNRETDVFLYDRHTGQLRSISAVVDEALRQGGAFSPAISADGRYVAFCCTVWHHLPGDMEGRYDVFLYDRQTEELECVSVGHDGSPADHHSHNPSISDDGRYVAFESEASNLVTGDTNGLRDVFVADRLSGTVRRVNTSSAGTEANDESLMCEISGDGGYVVFASLASTLVPGDTHNNVDIFLADVQAGEISCVTRAPDGSQMTETSLYPSISSDGRYVAFECRDEKLLPDDPSGNVSDVYVYDRQTSTLCRVSVTPDGAPGNDWSARASISANGRYVAFDSKATDLVPPEAATGSGVYMFDLETSTMWAVTVSLDGDMPNDECTFVDISGDGSYMTFVSEASNLVPDDTRWRRDVFVCRTVPTAGPGTHLVELAPGEVVDGVRFGNHIRPGVIGGMKWNDLDGDGEWDDIGQEEDEFLSGWTIYLDLNRNGQLDPGEPTDVTENGGYAFRGLAPGEYVVAEVPQPGWCQTFPSYGDIERLNVAADGSQANDRSFHSAFSADGRFVAFRSGATNLVPEDTNGKEDVFLVDRQTGTGQCVSMAWDGSQANGTSDWPTLSADGRFVAFESDATNLVPGGSSLANDVYVFDRQTNSIECASRGLGGSQGGGFWPAISANGRFVTFTSRAGNLVPGDTNGEPDVFVYDRQTGTTERVSVASDGSQADRFSYHPEISADGRFVTFYSGATTLAPGDTNGEDDVFVYDRQTDIIQRVSVASDGSQGDGDSLSPSISADGRYVAFLSRASNLVPEDTNSGFDIFLHDRQTATTRRVSVAADGSQANGESYVGVISGDGRYVAFYSHATNLAPGDTNGEADVFVYDCQAGTIRRVSDAYDGSQANDMSHQPAISPDGRFVAFQSYAGNLVPDDTNGTLDIFVVSTRAACRPGSHVVSLDSGQIVGDVDFGNRQLLGEIRGSKFHDFDGDGVWDDDEPSLEGWTIFLDSDDDGRLDDREPSTVTDVDGDYSFTGLPAGSYTVAEVPQVGWEPTSPTPPPRTIQRVNTAADGSEANDRSVCVSLSADGRFVAFDSAASNLMPGDTNGKGDVFVRDLWTGSIERVSITTNGTQGNGWSTAPSISADGQFVAFTSGADNLVPGDRNIDDNEDVFLYDRHTGTLSCVSLSLSGVPANHHSMAPSISADGRFVAFSSSASDLVPGDTNSRGDVFVYDRQTGLIERVSVASDGTEGNHRSQYPAISADGCYVAFSSYASNLVAEDTGGFTDVFVHDRQTKTTERVSVSAEGAQGNNTSGSPSISADGRWVAFSSAASNLVPGNPHGKSGAFLYDRQSGAIACISLRADGCAGNDGSHAGNLSADGRYVAMVSYASDQVPGDTDREADVLVYDRLTKTTWLASVCPDGTQSNSHCRGGALSADGRLVAFVSDATNLIADDHNMQIDVFVTGNPAGRLPQAHTVVVEPGQVVEDVDFGNQLRTGQIHGRKFSDANLSGTWDDGEGALAGWTIYLDLNHNGAWDAEEPSTRTDADGRYSFRNLPPGTHVVREVLRDRWWQTYPGRPDEPAQTPHMVHLDPGQVVDGVNFGNFCSDAPVIVSTLVDENDGDYRPGDLSLREALTLAAVWPGDDTIRFDPQLCGGTITLRPCLGQLHIDSNVEILGLGADRLTVDADGNGRVFYVPVGITATISGLTITGGQLVGDHGAGLYNDGALTITDAVICGNQTDTDSRGGGIYNDRGTLTVVGTTIVGNHAGAGGGLKNFHGQATLTDVTIYGNTAREGGGVGNHYDATMTIINATISKNSPEGIRNFGNLTLSAVTISENSGGGILNEGPLSIADSTICNNAAVQGGGIRNYRHPATLINTTISGNSSQEAGGGIYVNGGSMTLLNTTIADNRAGSSGGGIFRYHGHDAVVTLHNTIVADNLRADGLIDDVAGVFDAASSHNLIGAIDGSTNLDSGSGTLYGTAASPLNPRLGPLQDNGGSTLTHALLPSSPALDAASNDRANDAGLTHDQRGFDRFVGSDVVGTATVDMGAYEFWGIEGFAWEDLNGDGIQDAMEIGVHDATVHLLDASLSMVATTTTDVNGNYGFSPLLAGEYTLEFVVPAWVTFSPQDQGGNDVTDSDVDPLTGRTAPLMLTSGQSADRDAGLSGPVAAAQVGDRVWNDLDGNGIQDPDEFGVGEVVVSLLDSNLAQIATTTTAPDGAYSFDELAPGWYSLQFGAPDGFTFSPMNRGNDDLLDSDVNRSTGRTASFCLTAGQDDTSRDAGLYAGPFDTDVQSWLRITEIMPDVSHYDPQYNEYVYAEFIELTNIGPEPLDLTGVRFIDGIDFDFRLGSLASLFPGEHLVLVDSLHRFSRLYETAEINIAGQYEGRLDNQPERIELVAPINEIILEFSYDPEWFAITTEQSTADDPGDFSLTILDETADPPSWDGPSNWRPSSLEGGSPGTDDPRLTPDPGAVVINEIMTNPSDRYNDWIELHNTTGEDVDIGGWYLADDENGRPRFTSYRIAPGTIISAGGYVVFTRKDHFGFGLSSYGERLQLTAGDAEGNLLGYSESVIFGGAETDVTFGPYGPDFVALGEPTRGSENASPKVGPVVINEIMYQPGYLGDESLELYNVTAEPVNIGGWGFDGIWYDLPADTLIPGHGFLLLVPIDPEEFRAGYAIADEVPIMGPYDGALDNAGEDLRLYKRGDRNQKILADRVHYDDELPWPEEADLGGGSLERVVPTLYGNTPANWAVTTVRGGTPGQRNSIADTPVDLAITKTDGQEFAQPGQTITYTITVTNHSALGVMGGTVTDLFPSELIEVTWTAVASLGSRYTTSGTGDIQDTIDLAAGGAVTYTATGTIDPAATGTLTNEATVATPAGLVEATPEDNTASDTDTLISLGLGDIVSTAIDEIDGDYSPGDLSLREALALAAWLSGDDVIQFDSSLMGATITLDPALGQLLIDSNVSIQGPGADRLTIDADGNSRVFYVSGGVEATISGLAITGGNPDNAEGGGIYNRGDLTIANSTISGNSASADAPAGSAHACGGIYSRRDLTITNSTVSGNSASADAPAGSAHAYGGIYSRGNLTITNSTVSGNSASADAPAGSAHAYGGIYSRGNLTITNSTVSGNSVSATAPSGSPHANGGGVYVDDGTVILHNTIVAGNFRADKTTADDVYGSFDTASSHNLIGVIDGSTGLEGNGTLYGTAVVPLDPMLGPLRNNGGSTPTHALLPGSPAIDAGDNDRALDAGLTVDQRGLPRFFDGDGDGTITVDMGAYEYELTVPAEVVDRHVFYSDSFWDTPTAKNSDFDDDTAIAPDKKALLPGETATFANYTNYSSGINGIMVDIVDLPLVEGPIDPTDYFLFRVGNDDTPSGWDSCTVLPTATVRPGEGVDYSDRVTLIWPEGAVRNQWLQVTVLANENTGLAQNDVFYFGNLIAETGDKPDTEALVSFADFNGYANHYGQDAPSDSPYDFDRDGAIAFGDFNDLSNNYGHSIELITVPTAKDAKSPSRVPKASRSVPTRGAAMDVRGIDRVSAHDAVLEQAARRESKRRTSSPAKADWLWQFEAENARGRTPKRSSSVETAVDVLLATGRPWAETVRTA